MSYETIETTGSELFAVLRKNKTVAYSDVEAVYAPEQMYTQTDIESQHQGGGNSSVNGSSSSGNSTSGNSSSGNSTSRARSKSNTYPRLFGSISSSMSKSASVNTASLSTLSPSEHLSWTASPPHVITLLTFLSWLLKLISLTVENFSTNHGIFLKTFSVPDTFSRSAQIISVLALLLETVLLYWFRGISVASRPGGRRKDSLGLKMTDSGDISSGESVVSGATHLTKKTVILYRKTKNEFERFIFPWIDTSLLFRHRLWELLRGVVWVVGMVGSFSIFCYFRSKGCNEIVNDTWISDSPVLQLPSTQCGISVGGGCAITAVLLNFFCFGAMYILDGNYQRMLIDEVLEINQDNLKATEEELELVLMRKRLRNSQWEIGENGEVDVSYIFDSHHQTSCDGGEGVRQIKHRMLRPPTGTQTQTTTDTGRSSDKFSVHLTHEPEGGKGTVELVNGTYVNLDADQIFEKNTVRALTTVKVEPPDTENESDEEEGDGSGLWNGNEEKRSGGGWWKSVKRQWNGAKKRSNDNFIVSSRIDCESQIEEGAVQGEIAQEIGILQDLHEEEKRMRRGNSKLNVYSRVKIAALSFASRSRSKSRGGRGSKVFDMHSIDVDVADDNIQGELNMYIPATSKDSRLTQRVISEGMEGRVASSRLSSLTGLSTGGTGASISMTESQGGWGDTLISRFRRSFMAGGDGEEGESGLKIGTGEERSYKKIDTRSAIERILAQETRFKAEQKAIRTKVARSKGFKKKGAKAEVGAEVGGGGGGDNDVVSPVPMSRQNVQDLLLLTSEVGGGGVGGLALGGVNRGGEKKTSLESVREKIERIRTEERRIKREARKQQKKKERDRAKVVATMPVIKEGGDDDVLEPGRVTISFHASVKDEIGEEEDERERRLDEGIWIDLKRHNKKLATVNQELLALFELTRELMKGGSKEPKSSSSSSSGIL
ncbi:hypothetical protein TrST_g954 [Triparma strigata]|uniref:Uncharacterized protein n=1 Tax=Triparma strigata TaxID=1606541 RepID=A0A9W7BKI5_9STRA|nr:hypothetical protein TrST_g954 [Triparma strigata]